jgi:hypothetical protein
MADQLGGFLAPTVAAAAALLLAAAFALQAR